MIHILRWIAIIGTCAFFWWVYRPQMPKPRYPRKRTQREFHVGRSY